MGRPKDGYRLADGTRVPGVTTVIGRFKESGGLIHWAWKLGIEGVDYRERRDSDANSGTLTHELIDTYLHGGEPRLPDEQADTEMGRAAWQGYQSFRRWADSTRIELTSAEESIVSEEYRFGGTPDGLGKIGDETVLLDWKTSSRIYPDYIVQVAAYRHLWELKYPDVKITGIHILRADKEYGSFAHFSWPLGVLDLGWRAFVRMRELYDLDASLKRAAGV